MSLRSLFRAKKNYDTGEDHQPAKPKAGRCPICREVEASVSPAAPAAKNKNQDQACH